MEAQRRREGVVPIVLDLCTRWGWMVNATPRPLYSLVRHRYPLYRTGGLMGPSADLEGCGEEKNLLFLLGFEPQIVKT
jgi:hypothetical protein